MTFSFNLSICVITGINWAAVERTHFDSIGFTYFANYMTRYSKQKFAISLQEQSMRFKVMAGYITAGEDKTNELQDEPLTEAEDDTMLNSIDARLELKEGYDVLLSLQKRISS